MDEFSGINAFFNMIYHHDRASSRALLDTNLLMIIDSG